MRCSKPARNSSDPRRAEWRGWCGWGVVEEALFGVEEVLGGVAGGAVLCEHGLAVGPACRRRARASRDRASGSRPSAVSWTATSGCRASSTTRSVAASRSSAEAKRRGRSWRSVSARTFQRVQVAFSADTVDDHRARQRIDGEVSTGPSAVGPRAERVDLQPCRRRRRPITVAASLAPGGELVGEGLGALLGVAGLQGGLLGQLQLRRRGAARARASCR